jgi:hypothetical protein
METVTRVTSAPAVSEPQTAPPLESQPILDQAMDLLESQEAASSAIIQAQIMIFKEGLEIGKNMAQQMIKMLDGSQLLARSAALPQQAERTLDMTA